MVTSPLMPTVFTGYREGVTEFLLGDRILTGTATLAPRLSQVHTCLQNKGWERIRRRGFLSGYCQAKFASFGPQATLHMTWKKRTYKMDVMGSLLPFDYCENLPSNPPYTGFCSSTERSLKAQLGPITLIQTSLMFHTETKLSFLTFAHTSANPEALVHKWILRNQPDEQKES